MEIIVVGCGRLGSALAARLDAAGHTISVIDSDPEAYFNLPPSFSGSFQEGDALMQDVLVRAGIERVKGLAVVTNSDALNVVIGHIGKEIYHIPNVIVRNYDPRCRLLFEEMNIQVVSSTSWGAQRIEEMLFDLDIRTVFSAGNGEVEVYEFSVPSHLEGQTIADVFSATQCVPVSLTRAGQSRLPEADMKLLPGDVLNFSASFEGVNDLRKKISAGEEG